MSFLYVTEPGSTVAADGNRLQIIREGETLRWVPISKLQQLILIGPIGLTVGARNLCLKHGIDTIFLSSSGAYRGRLIGPLPAYAELRWLQYQQLHNPDFALAFTREIVRGKIVNLRNLLLKRTEPTPATTELRQLATKAAAADSIDVARGYEGRAAALYYNAFGGLITNPDFSFTSRNRQPPRDPLNILLSLGYTILAARVESAIHQTGLDIALGALHLPQNGKPSLALDLMEEFRPSIVDTTVLRCVNLRILRPDDFHSTADSTDYLANAPAEDTDRPLRFQKEALHKYLTQLDNKFLTHVFYPPLAAKLSFRDVILHQVRRFIRALKNEDSYVAFTPHL